MSTTIQRDKRVKGKGKAPTFQVRITPELKAQFELAASNEGISLGNWFKTLGRKELERLGIEPKA
ncbi:MAG: toxin-antitoxin system HicB family antitoxin [Plesiomonas shigelloides]